MILVTGATGHLGANLVRQLLRQGAALRLLVRDPADPALAGLEAERVSGDLRDPEACRRALAGVRQVYHCAARISTFFREHDEIFQVNVIGTRNLLQAARAAGVEKVVVSGSFSATGHRPDRPTDETEPFNPLQRHLPYAFTKAAVEHECLKACAEGLPVVVAVSCAIVGPWDFKPSRLGQVMIRMSRGRVLAYVPGGFEFVAARDIVAGHLLAMERGRPGQKYIFSTQFLEFEAVLRMFAEVTGGTMPPLRVPAPLMRAVAATTQPLLRLLTPDRPQLLTPAAIRLLQLRRRTELGKAIGELGYQPTDIASAAREAHAWFVAQGRIAPARAAAPRPALAERRP
jgi:nucleoside-diphosphate-sugar epimerase